MVWWACRCLDWLALPRITPASYKCLALVSSLLLFSEQLPSNAHHAPPAAPAVATCSLSSARKKAIWSAGTWMQAARSGDEAQLARRVALPCSAGQVRHREPARRQRRHNGLHLGKRCSAVPMSVVCNVQRNTHARTTGDAAVPVRAEARCRAGTPPRGRGRSQARGAPLAAPRGAARRLQQPPCRARRRRSCAPACARAE